MRETWYVLEDGAVADPSDVLPDSAGVLRHKNGTPVAMRGDAHSSRSVDPEEERAKAKSKARDMKAEEAPKQPYRTRDMPAS